MITRADRIRWVFLFSALYLCDNELIQYINENSKGVNSNTTPQSTAVSVRCVFFFRRTI